MGVIIRILRWVFEKFAAASAMAVLALAAAGLWLFLKDNVDFDQWRGDMLRAINGERTKILEAKADVTKRMDRIAVEITAEQQRAAQADKVLAQLKELESAWDRLTRDAQQKANDARMASVAALRQNLTVRIAILQDDFKRATWERDGLDIALGKLDQRLAEVQAQQSRVMHYLERVWEYPVGRAPIVLPVKWWLAIALGLYFFGPSVGKFSMYFFVAPLIERGRPVRLAKSTADLPAVDESQVSITLPLREGEKLWVREKFLQASDEGLAKKTRLLLDWRVPLTCLASGLVELVELRNAAGEKQLTLANQADPLSELAVVTLGEGMSLVLRPSFLAGAVVAANDRVRIRRRWQLFRWQAWVTLQFRFFEFCGPCRLIVAGKRGVRVERLVARPGAEPPARRANQDATMGFTTDLDYKPVRAETFWGYYRGMNPLFDDLFAGRGIFLCQQIATDGDAKQARKFWSGVWNGVLKVFGL
jgi:hypothetical protein